MRRVIKKHDASWTFAGWDYDLDYDSYRLHLSSRNKNLIIGAKLFGFVALCRVPDGTSHNSTTLFAYILRLIVEMRPPIIASLVNSPRVDSETPLRDHDLKDTGMVIKESTPLTEAEFDSLLEVVKHISHSSLFDAKFYLDKNPDVKAAGMDPALHYFGRGAFEGRDPSPAFSSSGYLANNPDIAAAEINPLLHYELYGRAEGRTPSFVSSRVVAYVDVNDKCNLRCPNCVRGVQYQKNTSKMMPLSTFGQIANKIKLEGYPKIALYSWTEPFLCKTLHEYVAIVKSLDLLCEISSNLSHPPKDYLPSIINALSAGVDHLVVSVSGISQTVYSVYHQNGKIDLVKANLEAIADQCRSGGLVTQVTLKFLKFPHNLQEEKACADYAIQLGIGFEVIDGVGDPNMPTKGEDVQRGIEARLKSFNVSHQIGSELEHKTIDANLIDNICCLIADTIAIDASGDVYQCCAYPYVEQLRIGQYINLTEDELLLRRYTHPICASCDFPRRDVTGHDIERLCRATRSTH